MIRPLLLMLAVALSACAHKPPVQEMADARAAVEAARQMPGDAPAARRHLQSAERALAEAAAALKKARYEMARQKALEARKRARMAARIKQKRQHAPVRLLPSGQKEHPNDN